MSQTHLENTSFLKDPFRVSGIYCFLIFICLYWTSAYPVFNLFWRNIKVPFVVFFLILSMFFAMISLPSNKAPFKGLVIYLFSTGYFMLGVLISNLGNTGGFKAIIELTLYVFIPLAAFLLSGNHPISFIRKSLTALWINGTTMACIGLFRLLVFGAPWMEIINHEKAGFGSRNLDAFFIMIGMISGIILLSNIQKTWLKIFIVFTGFISFVAVIFSFSRGMILTSLLAMSLIFFQYKWKTKLIMLFTLLPLSIMLIIGVSSSKTAQRAAALSFERFMLITSSEKVTRSGIHNSVPGRIKLIPLSLKAIKENPITGLGYGKFADYAKRNFISVNDPHNNFLLVWTELGSIAFFGYLVMAALPILIYARARRISKDNLLNSTFLLFAFVLTFTSCFTNYITYYGYWMIFAIILPGNKLNPNTA
ncbi:MAG: O-antigen ligase family protein [Desulfobacteraceae bacterium]|nr:O-antigen ligase family protein [Desulfobacteraceae bacterium]